MMSNKVRQRTSNRVMQCPRCGSKDLEEVVCCGGKTNYKCKKCKLLSRSKDVKRGELPSQNKEKKDNEKET